MAQIDEFIRELHTTDADQLVVAAGRPVTLTSNGSERTLTAAEPTARQVERLLGEILPPDTSATDENFAFDYEAPSGPVTVRARMSGDTTRIWCRPSGTPATPEEDGRAAGGRAGEGAPDAPGEPDEARTDGPVGGPAPGARAESDEAGGAAAGAPDGGGEPDEADGASPSAAPEPLPDDGAAIDRLLRKMVAEDCSDLHVSAGTLPLFRKDGDIVQLGDEERLSPEQTREMMLEITPERNLEQFEATNDTDFAYEIPGLARFRVNLFRDRKGVGGVFRQIPAEIMTAEDLDLSDAILGLCDLNKGLVVVTGPTGSGKSTTLAAVVDYINRTRKAHIITIEDPIEFVHENKKCLINQREVGVHTEGFKVALRAALREDPDIVLVGEMRDLETVEIALETAETGHLVFGTLHTNTAPSTVDRIIDQFPADQQNQIRAMLSESLKAVIAQTLCKVKGGGRTAAMEVLLVTNAVSNLIREGKTFQIPSLMQTGSGAGMRTLNDSLLELVQTDQVTPREAYRNAVDKDEFEQLLERHGYELEAVPGPDL